MKLLGYAKNLSCLAKTKAVFISTTNVIIWSIATLIVWVWESIGNLLWFIVENSKRIPENIWVAFNNIPFYIQSGLNKALKSIEDFINKSSSLLNKLPWVEIWPVNIWKITWATQYEYNFTGISAKNFQLTQKTCPMNF